MITCTLRILFLSMVIYFCLSFKQIWTTEYTGLVDKVIIIESDRGSKNDPPGTNTNYSPGILEAKLSLGTLI